MDQFHARYRAAEATAGAQVPGWAILLRFAGWVMALLVLWVGILLLWFRLSLSALADPGHLPPVAVGLYGVGLYLILLATAWWAWRCTGQPLKVAFSGRMLAEGLAIGMCGLAVLAGIELASGWIVVGPRASLGWGGMLSALGVGMAFALSEEALFRGFLLGLLSRDLSRGRAIWLSSAIFAASHFLHPLDLRLGVVEFAGLLVAGALLASLRLRARSLWPAVGLHASWIAYITASGQEHWWSIRHMLWTGGGNPAAGLLGLCLLPLTYLWVRHRYPDGGPGLPRPEAGALL